MLRAAACASAAEIPLTRNLVLDFCYIKSLSTFKKIAIFKKIFKKIAIMEAFGAYSDSDSEEAQNHDASSAPAAPLFKPAWQEEALDADDSDEDAGVQAAAEEAKRIKGSALPAAGPGCEGPG